MEKILFIGPPGCGKGTQAKLLVTHGLAHISTGDEIRSAIANHDPIISEYADRMHNGQFIPDEAIFEILEKKISGLQGFIGYVLDGAARNLNQAKVSLEKALIDEVFYFSLPEEIALERIRHRYQVEKRKDDHPEISEVRLREYYKQTQPVVDYLSQTLGEKDFHNLSEYALKPIPEIHDRILAILGLPSFH